MGKEGKVGREWVVNGKEPRNLQAIRRNNCRSQKTKDGHQRSGVCDVVVWRRTVRGSGKMKAVSVHECS